MCHGLPRRHPCAHTSVYWHYCPSAIMDLDTNFETPCQNQSFAATTEVGTDCPLSNCTFKELGGSWNCCNCGQGPNSHGWCMKPVGREYYNPATHEFELVDSTCDHGCCKKCSPAELESRPSSPEPTFVDRCRGGAGAGRKRGGCAPTSPPPSPSARPQRRGAATFSIRTGYGTVSDGAEQQQATPPPSARSSQSKPKTSTKNEHHHERGKKKSSARKHKAKAY